MNLGTVISICKLKSSEKIMSSRKEGEVPMPSLNSFSDFFFAEKSNFNDLKKLLT